jgi:hypothetical protein
MVGAGIVFAEPSVDEGVVGWLVVDPQEEELLWLEVGLEFEHNRLEGDSAGRELWVWLQLLEGESASCLSLCS